MTKVPAVPNLNITIQIELPQAAPAARRVSKKASEQPPVKKLTSKVNMDAVKRRIKSKTLTTELTANSSRTKLNADIYPDKTTHNNTPEGKGMTPKPRPGYFH